MAANSVAWTIFQHLTTQAKVGGMGGVFGFDYSALPVLFTAYSVQECQWANYMEKIHVLSSIGVKHWNRKDESKK